MKIEEGVSLARFTTIGTGGPTRVLARPETVGELEEALRFAREHDFPVADLENAAFDVLNRHGKCISKGSFFCHSFEGK